MKKWWLLITGAALLTGCQYRPREDARQVLLLDRGWLFINKDLSGAEKPGIATEDWEAVEVPHDWAISGTFDPSHDAIERRGRPGSEGPAPVITGSTGALPHVGVGWYRIDIEIPGKDEGKRILVEFDGAMSHAEVYLNGNFVGEWPYGYASFGFDLTPHVKFGESNLLAVRLENLPNSQTNPNLRSPRLAGSICHSQVKHTSAGKPPDVFRPKTSIQCLPLKTNKVERYAL